jgi:hypothetical protein
MELSHKHRFIFIHVYRAGGKSVCAALKPHTYVPRYVPRRRFDRVPLLRRTAGARVQRLRLHNWGHIKAKELQAGLPADIFDSYFKFAFVRNPWEWQVSIYHHVRQYEEHPDRDFYLSFGGFADYLDWRINETGTELQTEFILSDSGRLLVDFVGHYDTLAEDFATVCGRIGIQASLPHVNASMHRDFREYYTPATRALVAKAYRDDIEFFGYEFDRRKRLSPIVPDNRVPS